MIVYLDTKVGIDTITNWVSWVIGTVGEIWQALRSH